MKMNKSILIITSILLSVLIVHQGKLFASTESKFIQPGQYKIAGFLAESDVDDMAKYDIVALTRFNWNLVKGDTWDAIKKLNPDIEIYLYQLGTETSNKSDSNSGYYLNSIARWGDTGYGDRAHSKGNLSTDNPSLFLLDSGGNRIYNVGYPSTYEMKFGSSSFQSYWLEATITDIVNQPWVADGIMLDNCTAWGSSQPNGNAQNTTYTTASSWNTAMNSFINAITYGLRTHNQKTWVNTGNTRTVNGSATWLAIDASTFYPDVIMEEGAFVSEWGPESAQIWSEEDWKRQIDTFHAIKNCKVMLVSTTDLAVGASGKEMNGYAITFYQLLWYSMCSYHLAKDTTNRLYFDFGTASYADYGWYDEYDYINLGNVLGNYQVKAKDGINIYYREFDKGYVVVNPTIKDVSNWPIPGGGGIILNHDNFKTNPTTVVSTVSIPKHTGIMILKQITPPNSPLNLWIE